MNNRKFIPTENITDRTIVKTQPFSVSTERLSSKSHQTSSRKKIDCRLILK